MVSQRPSLACIASAQVTMRWRLQVAAQERDRVVAQRQADMAVVLDDLAAGGHRPQRHRRLVDLRHRRGLAGRGGREQRQRLVAQRLDRPQRLAAGKAERRPEGVGLGEPDQARRPGRPRGARGRRRW